MSFLLPAGITAGSILYLLGCTQIQIGTVSFPEEWFVPVIFGSLLFVGGATLMVLGYRQRPSVRSLSTPVERYEFRDVLLLTAGLGAYVLFLPIIGFSLSTFGILVLSAWIMGNRWTAGLLLATAVTVASYVIFIYLLDIPFPSGFLA